MNKTINMGNIKKISNLINNNNNKEVKNQFSITTENGILFQSYKSIICFIDQKNNKIYLDGKYYNYSTTTSKHRNNFLRVDNKTFNDNLKNNKYILTDLNN
jgi:hypothetical protein